VQVPSHPARHRADLTLGADPLTQAPSWIPMRSHKVRDDRRSLLLPTATSSFSLYYTLN